MSVFGDFKELRDEWKKNSFSGKVFLIISTIFATTSLTSISEIVVKWRGFMLEVIRFYQKWVRQPFRNFLDWFGLDIELVTADLLIVVSVIFGCFLRFCWYLVKNELMDFDDLISWVLTSVFCFFLIALANDSDSEKARIVFLIFLMIVMLIFSLVIAFAKVEKWKPAIFQMWAPLIIGAVIVSILAGLNEGFSKPLT